MKLSAFLPVLALPALGASQNFNGTSTGVTGIPEMMQGHHPSVPFTHLPPISTATVTDTFTEAAKATTIINNIPNPGWSGAAEKLTSFPNTVANNLGGVTNGAVREAAGVVNTGVIGAAVGLTGLTATAGYAAKKAGSLGEKLIEKADSFGEKAINDVRSVGEKVIDKVDSLGEKAITEGASTAKHGMWAFTTVPVAFLVGRKWIKTPSDIAKIKANSWKNTLSTFSDKILPQLLRKEVLGLAGVSVLSLAASNAWKRRGEQVIHTALPEAKGIKLKQEEQIINKKVRQ